MLQINEICIYNIYIRLSTFYKVLRVALLSVIVLKIKGVRNRMMKKHQLIIKIMFLYRLLTNDIGY